MLALVFVNAGLLGQPEELAACTRQAVGFVVDARPWRGRYLPEDGLALADAEATVAMTKACRALVLSRAATLMRERNLTSIASTKNAAQSWSVEDLVSATNFAMRDVRLGQISDGSWGCRGRGASRTLSVATWSLLALRTGMSDVWGDESLTRGGKWVERFVARIESLGGSDLARLAHARAARALVRAVSQSRVEDVATDLLWLLETLGSNRPVVEDAEVILFGTLAATKCADEVRDRRMKADKPLINDTQIRQGCAAGTWTTPSIWFEDGGRLVSTALMTWALEVYYRYPMALWLD
jgi:hypothetical protein